MSGHAQMQEQGSGICIKKQIPTDPGDAVDFLSLKVVNYFTGNRQAKFWVINFNPGNGVFLNVR